MRKDRDRDKDKRMTHPGPGPAHQRARARRPVFVAPWPHAALRLCVLGGPTASGGRKLALKLCCLVVLPRLKRRYG